MLREERFSGAALLRMRNLFGQENRQMLEICAQGAQVERLVESRRAFDEFRMSRRAAKAAKYGGEAAKSGDAMPVGSGDRLSKTCPPARAIDVTRHLAHARRADINPKAPWV